MLVTFGIAVAVAGSFVGAYVWMSLGRERRQQRVRGTAFDPFGDHREGWDYVVDGRVVARLDWAGPPEDLNTGFVPFEVSVAAGCEAEVETLLYRSNMRKPIDERICFRWRGEGELVVEDSKVLVGHYGGHRVGLKMYW